MKLELIVMFTHQDRTVSNACELFYTLESSTLKHFGLKDIGLPRAEMEALAKGMSEAGKTTYLEVVSLSEEEGLAGARLAVELGVDILMGTVYFDSINDLLREEPTKYYPFAGHVHSHPSILDGSIEEIVAHARALERAGVDGIDLLTYRHPSGKWSELLTEVVRATNIPIVSAGSIDSFERIAEVSATGAWGYTIGSAFFDQKFAEEGTFTDNVVAVWEWMQTDTMRV